MKRRTWWRIALRVIVVWLITSLTLYGLAAVMPGVQVKGWWAALGGAAAIGILNGLLWPLLVRFALPVTVYTLGLGGLLLNGLIVGLAAWVVPGFVVSDVWSGIVVTLGLALVTTVVTSLLAIDDDDFYYRNVVRRAAARQGAVRSSVPGLIFLEIDGLAHEVLLRAIRNGEAPTMARWLRDGSHRLTRWETDWSSQTGACQAGLLHGSNADMPAFRWWEKERAAAIVTNHPKDAAEIERRHSNGRGLLAFDGASRANILSGDAPHSMLTMSTVARRQKDQRIGRAYFGYFANPYSVVRTIILSLADIASEYWHAAQQKRKDIRPRVPRGLAYGLVRAWATVIQRELQVTAVIQDIYAGRPVVYTTFLAYDEVAHHSGIERPDAVAVLGKVDRQFGRIVAAADDAPRPYRFVVLSDHGQSQGATFKDRYHQTLEDVVRQASESGSVESSAQGTESSGLLAASLTEVSGGDGAVAKTVRVATRGRRVDGVVQSGEDRREEKRRRRLRASARDGVDQAPELVVMASGCLGLIYFARHQGRLTLEQIQELYPRVIPALRDHPGVGFLLVRSRSHGALAIGRGGINHIDGGRVEGTDPLAPFGPNAAHHLRRTDGFEHVADIMVNSTYWAETDEVAAFEELVGSHGGMGGSQSFPFALFPQEWAFADEPVLGAEAMHRWMRRWLADLGHEHYLPVAAAGDRQGR